MLRVRELVNASGSTSAELEAVTAERDFFREKYAEQINEMEHLKGQLRESQRVIDKLRGQVLDLEIEKAGLMQAGGLKSLKQIESGGDSTDTSVTALASSDDDLTAKSTVENNAMLARASEVGNGSVGEDEAASAGDNDDADNRAVDQEGVSRTESLEEEDQPATGEEVGGKEDEGEESDDEANDIRANAERMLLWANYQTSKSRTPNTSAIQDDASKTETVGSHRSLMYDTPSKMGLSPNAIVYSLPTSLDRRRLMDDDESDESSLGSSSRHPTDRSVASCRSGGNANNRASNGKIGNLLNNLRDMIDPPSGNSDESTAGS